MKERHFSRKDKSTTSIFILSLTLLLYGGSLFAAQDNGGSQKPAHKIYSPQNISAEQVKHYLSQLKISTVSRIPGPNVLLITAPSTELAKAVTMLQLVDVDRQFVIREILAASQAATLPPTELIASKVGDVAIGTFAEPPKRNATYRAIIDVYNDSVLLIAPTSRADTIISAIAALKPAEAPVEKAVETKEPAAEQQKTAPPAEQTKVKEPEQQPQQDTAKPTLPPELQRLIAGRTEKPNKAANAGETAKVESPAGRATGQTSPADETFVLNLPEKLSIVDLLNYAGQHLNLRYIYDPQQIKGDITLSLNGDLRGAIQVKDLYPLLESVLKFRGFVMTRGNGNFVTVVPLQDALEIDPTLLTQEMEARPGDVIVTRVFHLEHIDTTNATTLLNNMKLSVAISPIPATGTLIVTGYSYRMGRVEQLLKMVDVPGKPRKFRYRVLKYTMAKTLAPKVKTLAEQLGTVSITISQTTTPSPLTARGRTATRPAVRPPTTTTQAKPTQATVYLDADERTNRILMIGLEDQLSVVEELIDALDVEQQDLRALKLYKIEFMDAEDVRKKLQELGVIGGSAGGTTTSSRITTPTTGRAATTTRPATIAQQATTRTTGNGPEALVEEPQVVVIEATNSLLVNATAEQHAQVSMILDYIDREIQKDEMPYKIYPLENQKPEDLAGVLEQLVQETIKDKEGKVEQVIKRQEDNIVIVPDENTFSIIVYASKKNQEWIANLIEQLDKRRPQVLIDVALVEITRTELFEYDLNIIANAKKLVTGNIAISGSVLPYASSVGNHLEAGWNLKDADGNPTGQIQGFYGEDKMQALFKAMDKKDYGRILAQPKVLVNDNEKGIISTVEKTYVKEETTLVPPDGIAQTATKWTEYPAKIELQITPNISEGELLRLEINMTREDFEKQTDKPPDYRTSNVTTVVTVPNGSTIILGGLTKLNQSKGGSKVPLLGDIPLVGGLFRSVANSDRASKLYIFVKANILRPEETVGLAQLQRISEENRAAFEEAERIFQDKRTIPGLKDKYMEPERVLGNIQLRKRVSPRVLSDTK